MKLLIWKADDTDFIYEFETENQKLEAVIDIIEKRLSWQYFFGDDEERAKDLLDDEDLSSMLKFLRERNDHEYERIEYTETMIL